MCLIFVLIKLTFYRNWLCCTRYIVRWVGCNKVEIVSVCRYYVNCGFKNVDSIDKLPRQKIIHPE